MLEFSVLRVGGHRIRHRRPSRPFGLRSLTQRVPQGGDSFNFKSKILELSPDHPVDDAGVALDDFHDLGRYVFFDVVGHGDAVVAVGVHRDSGVDGLQEGLFVDAGDEEAGLVKRFGAFRAGADADCRERVADACEEGAFFGERAAVAHDGECVHLQAVVVVESERFVLNHAFVELEARGGKAVTAARVAAVCVTRSTHTTSNQFFTLSKGY